MPRRLGQSISNRARLLGCSRSVVVSTYLQWSEEGQTMDRQQGFGGPKLINAQGQGYPIWCKLTEGLLWHKLEKM